MEAAVMRSDPDQGPAQALFMKSVLLVDDDPLMLELLRGSMERAGWDVCTAQTVADAKRILKQSDDITVVVSDIKMPGESGFELVWWLNETRRDDRHAEVILITGDADDDALIAALRSRVFDFMRKPFEPRSLLSAADRAYRTAYARRDRFHRLSAMDYALDQVRQERMQFQAQLREARAQFEDTQARLTYVGQTMARIVSHELRTPLIPIIGLAQVLESSDDLSPDEIREFAGEIRRAGESLANIVDNALNFVDIERQVRAQPHDEIAVAPLLNELVRELAPQTNEKRVAITMTCEAAALIYGPRHLLRGAILSLIDNAVKASPVGGTVSLSVRAGVEVTIDIRDRGPGLSDHVRANFGAPFMHGDNSDTRTWPGIGLGIASALRILAVCGGRLEVVASGADLGTLMRISLPAHERANA
ncbi:MAG: Signal transduction histidine kinase [Rhodobacteraceae bacterium HLUCCA12]|nr:MAG: Signal transduction histidine kinase [Rhodobacteraceae bacterium HLUCCA12]